MSVGCYKPLMKGMLCVCRPMLWSSCFLPPQSSLCSCCLVSKILIQWGFSSLHKERGCCSHEGLHAGATKFWENRLLLRRPVAAGRGLAWHGPAILSVLRSALDRILLHPEAQLGSISWTATCPAQ